MRQSDLFIIPQGLEWGVPESSNETEAHLGNPTAVQGRQARAQLRSMQLRACDLVSSP